jgi:hypothetical protein
MKSCTEAEEGSNYNFESTPRRGVRTEDQVQKLIREFSAVRNSIDQNIKNLNNEIISTLDLKLSEQMSSSRGGTVVPTIDIQPALDLESPKAESKHLRNSSGPTFESSRTIESEDTSNMLSN